MVGALACGGGDWSRLVMSGCGWRWMGDGRLAIGGW